jgi:hypothetical protein
MDCSALDVPFGEILRLFELELVRDPWAALVLARLEIRRLTRAGQRVRS